MANARFSTIVYKMCISYLWFEINCFDSSWHFKVDNVIVRWYKIDTYVTSNYIYINTCVLIIENFLYLQMLKMINMNVSGFKIDSYNIIYTYIFKHLYIFYTIFLHITIFQLYYLTMPFLFRLGNVSAYCRGEKQSGYSRSRNYPAVPKVGDLLFFNW